MYLALGIVLFVAFWLAVRASSRYLYGRDVASTLAHMPIYFPGGYRYIYRAVRRATARS